MPCTSKTALCLKWQALDNNPKMIIPTQRGTTMKYELGSTAVDTITGFTGVITGYAKYLTGGDQYLVLPKCEETGKYPDGQWFDENRLEVESNQTLVLLDTTGDPGACGVAPKY